MKRILLTGMSGTGRGKRETDSADGDVGHRQVNGDWGTRRPWLPGHRYGPPGWSEHAPDGDWIWREDRVRDALACEEGEVLFISGCATNQVRFYPQFDAIVRFSVPADVLIERLATRTNNPYGKHPDELADVLGYLETVEPRLRRSATHEIDTRAPLAEVVVAVLSIARVPEH